MNPDFAVPYKWVYGSTPMTLFRGRYRIETTRLKGFDYSKVGMYFVTICARKRLQWFGEIRNGVMWLSDVGVGI